MGFGKLRFRRSFGQVKSQFRGAIPKHFPLVQNLLDLYPATAAYSAYDLGNKRGSVTEAEGTVVNPVQRWRRSSDDALQMFTAEDIDDGTALTWAGTTAYLLTEYDQSGNDYDLTQTTAANQPLVVSGGVWVDATFDGVDDKLPITGAGLDMFKDVGYGQVFAVATSNETGLAFDSILRLGNDAGPTRYSLGESPVTDGSYRIGGRRLDSDTFDSTTASTPHGTTQKIVTGFLNYADGEAYLYQNGVNVGTDLSFQTAGNTSNTSSANGDLGGPAFNGKISAVVVYNTDQTANRIAIEAKLNAIIPTY